MGVTMKTHSKDEIIATNPIGNEAGIILRNKRHNTSSCHYPSNKPYNEDYEN